MLSTPVHSLKAMQKKEEYQFKKRAMEIASGKRITKGLLVYGR